MNDMNNNNITTTFTAIFPDGTTETRKSKTHAYTYAVATYVTAERDVAYCECEIRRLSKYDDKASRKQVAKLQARIEAAVDYWSVRHWCGRLDLAQAALAKRQRLPYGADDRIVEVK
jgi:hypothetical protein